jgi:GAF domain-containing protein
MAVSTEDVQRSWAQDKQRFVADAEEAHRLGRSPLRDHGFRLGPLALQFAELTASLLDARSVDDVLQQVVATVTKVAPQVDVVSVTLRSPDGQFHTPVATHTVARLTDELQYDVGEGPCVTAAEPGGPAVASCPDLSASDTPWPRFSTAAAKLGIAAVLSLSLVPTPTAPRLSGALNLYSRQSGGLDDVDGDVLLLLATHASLALATTEAVTVGRLRDAQLRRAIDSRDVIGQAKGVLMVRRDVSADAAFDILRSASQRLNVKLVQIAEAVAARPDFLG